MAGINGMLSLTGLVFVVAEKPYKRSLIGSMVCACGHFLAVASFGGAYYAVCELTLHSKRLWQCH